VPLACAALGAIMIGMGRNRVPRQADNIGESDKRVDATSRWMAGRPRSSRLARFISPSAAATLPGKRTVDACRALAVMAGHAFPVSWAVRAQSSWPASRRLPLLTRFRFARWCVCRDGGFDRHISVGSSSARAIPRSLADFSSAASGHRGRIVSGALSLPASREMDACEPDPRKVFSLKGPS